MVHTYEVLIDMQEFADQSKRIGSARYEVDAESPRVAHETAFSSARTDYPRATEYDIRITRVLR
jgi:hypothetical protein